MIKQEVADYIYRRDGQEVETKDIYLSQGASEGVEFILRLLINKPTDGILVPYPIYPLYR